LWELLVLGTPPTGPDPNVLQTFFWQIARSRLDSKDTMRFGSEFVALDALNVRVLVNATVTCINTNEDGSAFESLEVSTIDGVRSRVRATAAVLAASGIEYPRLLLASRKVQPRGLGNTHDLVGRFLMDHLGARIGHFKREDCSAIMKRFGFYSLKHHGQAHLYMHGLVPSPELQRRERLQNCTIYLLEERSPDDPWSAMRRLLGAKSDSPISDVLAIVSSPGLVAKGVGMRLFESNAVPEWLKRVVINAPGRRACRTIQSRGRRLELPGARSRGPLRGRSFRVSDQQARRSDLDYAGSRCPAC
jgi:hypothetical protein